MKFPQGKATNWIAGVTAALFLPVYLLGYTNQVAFGAGFVPSRIMGTFPEAIVPFTMAPAWITPFTSTLIHADFLHLGLNMMMLLITGRFVEQVIGWRLLLLLYVLGAIGAAAAELIWNPGGLYPVIGASGAISAIMATYAMLYGQRTARSIGPIPAGLVQALWLLAAWAVVNLMLGFVGITAITGDAEAGGARLAVASHIGGFIVGLAMTRPLLRLRFGGRKLHTVN